MVTNNKMIPEEITEFINKLEADKESLNKKARLKLAHLKAICAAGKMTNKIQQEYEALVELAKDHTEEPKELSLDDLIYDGDIDELLSDPSLKDSLPYLMGKLVKVLNEEEPDGENPILDQILQLAADNNLDAEKLYFGGDLEKWLAVIKSSDAGEQARRTYANLVIAGDFGPVENVDAIMASYLKLIKENNKEKEMENVKEDVKEEETKEDVKEEETAKEEKKNESSFTDKAINIGKNIAVLAAILGVSYGVGYGIGKLIGDSEDIEIPDSIM